MKFSCLPSLISSKGSVKINQIHEKKKKVTREDSIQRLSYRARTPEDEEPVPQKIILKQEKPIITLNGSHDPPTEKSLDGNSILSIKREEDKLTQKENDHDILTPLPPPSTPSPRGSNISTIDDVLPLRPKPSGSVPNRKKKGISGESYNLNKLKSGKEISLPKYEKDSESEKLIRNAIKSNKFLKNGLDSDKIIQMVVDAMYPKDLPAGSFVIREGEIGSHLYVCAKGQFDVFKGEEKVNTLGPGKVFGELALLYNSKRNATIKATTACSLWVMDRKVFHKIMMKSGLQREEENIKFLRSVPLLRSLDRSVLTKMSDLLRVQFYAGNDVIIKQGDEGSLFYIISGGSVAVTIADADGKEKRVGTLGRGDYFGERALLNDDKRMATCTAEPPGVECLTLDRVPFIQLLGKLEDLQNGIDPDSKDTRPSVNQIEESEFNHVKLSELEVIGTLGVGGFGRVELVQYQKDKNQTFALKYLKKVHVVEQHQVNHAFNEKELMLSCRNPFICRLYKTYHDNKYLYFLMEACLGGDVWTTLQRYKTFDENTARFMTACVVGAFEYLHSRGIVYRDLKPENLLLDTKGYVKLVDFGFAKKLIHSSKTWTFAGTPEYVAPEIITNRGHDRAVDYWALGIFIHELMAGRPPFRGTDHLRTYNLILKGIDSIQFPRHVPKTAQFLIKKLCRPVPTDRLGYQKEGVAGIKNHRWFLNFDWDALEATTMVAPIIPRIKGPTDTSNFDKYPKDKETPPDDTTGWDAEF